jgi:hypothetical protein
MAEVQTENEGIIFFDNQAALRAIYSTQISGQQIIGRIFKKWDELRGRDIQVALRVILTHQGVESSELAGKAAK